MTFPYNQITFRGGAEKRRAEERCAKLRFASVETVGIRKERTCERKPSGVPERELAEGQEKSGEAHVLIQKQLGQGDEDHIGEIQNRELPEQRFLDRSQSHLPFLLADVSVRRGGEEYTTRNWDRILPDSDSSRKLLPRKGRDPVVVKGITRQVILVKSPDPKLFEEAIFIVKEEALTREGVNADQVIRQARQAADGYLKGNRAWNRRLRGLPHLPGPVWGAAGAALASGIWGAALFFLF